MLFWRLILGIPLRQDYSREFIIRVAKWEVKERGRWILQLCIEQALCCSCGISTSALRWPLVIC